MSKIFVVGDIHGSYKALKQVLEKSKFDYEKDTLICLGDVVDGWSETPQCIEELLKIKHLIFCMGNHDTWAEKWLNYGEAPLIWTQQGGQATIDAYLKDAKDNDKPLMIKHRGFFKKAVNYYIDEDFNCFVHGGINPNEHPSESGQSYLLWDRELYEQALRNDYVCEQYKEVFIGHTTVEKISKHPLKRGNVWLMDTGCGWGGRLALLDIDTHKFWVSDTSKSLYPNERGR